MVYDPDRRELPNPPCDRAGEGIGCVKPIRLEPPPPPEGPYKKTKYCIFCSHPNPANRSVFTRILARLRLRPTRRVYWKSHSGGSGALIDLFIDDGHTTAWRAKLFLGSPRGHRHSWH
jgi:hypothetical protein